VKSTHQSFKKQQGLIKHYNSLSNKDKMLQKKLKQSQRQLYLKMKGVQT